MKRLKTYTALAVILIASTFTVQQIIEIKETLDDIKTPQTGMLAQHEQMAAAIKSQQYSYAGSSIAGSYLSGRFAQRHHDWSTAGRYIDYVLNKSDNNDALLKRAMVLAMGSGEPERAFELARTLSEEKEEKDALSQMFLMAEAIKMRNFEGAAQNIRDMPESGLSMFIMPLLYSWSNAGLGQYEVTNLQANSIHLYHAILISEFMGQQDAIKDMLKQSLSVPELGAEDIERIADIYAHIGETETAAALYEKSLRFNPDNESLRMKYDIAKTGKSSDVFIRVKSTDQGVAEAFYDMARLLTKEYSDESAKVFGHLALYLDPQHTSVKFLLADIAERNDHQKEAIDLYKSIPASDERFLGARRKVAEILHDEGFGGQSIKELQLLVDHNQDIESLIQIGNVHRIDENFKDAIQAYNQVEEMLGGITSDYWYLHYVRGMAYEQDGQWEKAERDLQAALSYQPDHPYILNYLGYAWSDQGENLDKALAMIEKAVRLRPGDGYITDSLGWVYYKMNRFEDAVPHLERAVELMPYDPTINDHLGDAYWRVGRHLEARFQWRRARNHSEDETLISGIDYKINNGLAALELERDIQDASLNIINDASKAGIQPDDNTQLQ